MLQIKSDDFSQLNAIRMEEEDCKCICKWMYEVPYHIYNWPSWEELVHQQREFADPQIRQHQYYAVKTKNQQLVAYFQLFPLHNTIRLAIFVHPSLLNNGVGKQACLLAIKQAKLDFCLPYIDLEVATWNKRAIHVYEQVGFQIEDEYKLYIPALQHDETVYNMVYKK